jgi:hypothetical protein
LRERKEADMYWGVASLTNSNDVLYVNILQHNITSREEAEKVVEIAEGYIKAHNLQRLLLAFPQMLHHDTSHLNCASCMGAVEEAVKREEERHGRGRLEDTPSEAGAPPAQRVGQSLDDLL